ncbi:MAG: phosphoglycolate phosphatase [Gammaproteobacteria bacterium]
MDSAPDPREAGSPPPRSRIRTVLFDLDGTIADTAPDMAHAINEILRESGREPLPLEALRPHTSHGSRGLIQRAFGFAEEDERFAALRQRFLDLYSDHLAVHTRLFTDVEELLTALENRGYRWGIVTNKPAWLTDPLVEKLGLAQRAACVVSGDTAARSKPHPDPLHHACELLACDPEECLYVGDAERDIIAGRSAGMATLVAGFGYIHRDETPEEWGADGIVDSPRGVLEWLSHDT